MGDPIAARTTSDLTVAESATFLKTILESSTEYSIVATDLEGSILNWNEGARRLYGYESEEVFGSSVSRLYKSGGRPSERIGVIFDQVRHGGEWSGDLRQIHKSGAVFTAWGTFTIRRNRSGEPAGYTVITNRALDSSLSIARIMKKWGFTDVGPLAIIDPAGMIIEVSRQMCDLAGYTRKQFIGSQAKQFFTEPYRIEEILRQVLANGRATASKVVIKSRSRIQIHAILTGFTLRPPGSSAPTAVWLWVRDVSDYKRMEELLRRKNQELEEQNRWIQRADRLKTEFLANMSHELRTPLNAIIGFSELLHDGRAGAVSRQQKQYTNHVLIAARHLLALINDALDLSKVESGKMEFFPELIEPSKLVGEVRNLLRTLTARKRITLITEIEPHLKEVALDPTKLKQVLFNFLSNALKFTAQEGRVTVRMRPAGPDDFLIEVEDTGIGIRPEDLPRLFGEFQQLDASASKKYQGTGLGLALTKRIVEAQGGTISVTSTPGRGSTFSTRLPRVDRANPVRKAVASSLQPNAGARSVLVIEDDESDRHWLSATLESNGYAVQSAATGAEALRLLKQRPFDVITLDLMLPDMSGWDVLRQVRATAVNRRTPVIVMTVLTDQGGGIGLAIHDFLEKPMDRQTLLGAVRSALVRTANGTTILLVDDNKQDLKLFASALRHSGYATIAKSSAVAGLRAAAAKPPDLVVLDLLMPRVDGFEFLRRFRAAEHGRKTPVIVLTGKDLARQEMERLGAMAQGVVSKGDGSVKALLAEISMTVAGAPAHDAPAIANGR